MMNKQGASLILLLLVLPSTDLVSATNRPGSSFSANVISDVETAAPLQFTPEDIALCCTGNGDYGFMMRDLQVGALAEFDETSGFEKIPGVSLWTCRSACRDPDSEYDDIEACFDVCDCRQGCTTSNDTLTVECRDECNFPEDSEEQGLCLETCHTHCGERCRSTFNGYVIPLGVYRAALSILDCIYGDLVGEPEASCFNTSVYWEGRGYSCNYTAGVDFDCQCDVPGTCPNIEYPCKYDFHCVSESPSLVPSESPSDIPSDMPSLVPSDVPSFVPSSVPSDVPSEMPSDIPSELPSSIPSDVPSEMPSDIPSEMPSSIPSDVPSVSPSASPSAAPSAYPTWSPTPKPTKGKGKGGYDDDDYYYYDDDYDDDDRRRSRRRSRKGRRRDRRTVN